MINLIDKIGFFRLTLVPTGILIIVAAFIYGIWGMGIVGAILLVFGVLNKCVLLGQCEVKEQDKTEKYHTSENSKLK